MIENPIFFYISAFFLIVFTILSLFSKNIVYALLAAIIVFFSGALVFYILGSEYNAIIQAAVYGLAVPVIIGLSVMFSGSRIKSKEKKSATEREFKLKYLVLLCGGLFVLAFVYVIMISLAELPDTFNIVELPQVNSFDVLFSFAKGIYENYVWAFELFSLLLTISVAGFTLFNKKGRA